MPNISRDMIVVIQGLVILFAGALENLFRPGIGRAFAFLPRRDVAGRCRALVMDLLLRPADPQFRDTAVDAADPRGARRALFGALGDLRHRAGRQDAGRAPSPPARSRRRPAPPGSGSSPAIAASIVFALVHGFASITQRGNQIVSGVAINFLASGLTAFLGQAWFGRAGGRRNCRHEARFRPIELPGAEAGRDVPVLGPIYADARLRAQSPRLRDLPRGVVTAWVIYRTRFGLRLRAVGENPAAVDTAGISVVWLRYRAVMIAGLLCGIAGDVSRGRAIGRLRHGHDGGAGLHRARGADLRQLEAVAGARRVPPVRPPQRDRRSGCRACRCR